MTLPYPCELQITFRCSVCGAMELRTKFLNYVGMEFDPGFVPLGWRVLESTLICKDHDIGPVVIDGEEMYQDRQGEYHHPVWLNKKNALSAWSKPTEPVAGQSRDS